MSQRRRFAEDEFDPLELAERAIEANLDTSAFTEIDDRDIKRAKNWLEFTTGTDFLSMVDPSPWPRQIQLATQFFGEWCPRCSKPGFMRDIDVSTPLQSIREHVVFLEFGVCPKCKATQTEMFGSGELTPYDEFNMCAGQRSGKSALTGLLFQYQLHRILMIPNPARFYGLMGSATLHMTLIALTAGQIQDNIWDPFIIGVIDKSPWHRQYHAFLNHNAKRKGVRLHNVKDTYISYDHKGIILSYSGADFRKLRGKTRIATSIDECGWFDAHAGAAGVKTSAKGQHDALANSLRNVRTKAESLRASGRNWVPTGIDCNISSPSSATDMIMTMVRSNRRGSFPVHLPTWDINPAISYESIRHEELENKRAFDRDFRAVPPMADSAFMDDEQQVKRAITVGKQNQLLWNVRTEQDSYDGMLESRWLEVTARIKDKTVPRILGVDPGETNNSFGLVLASYRNDTQAVQIDGVLECQPQKFGDGKLSKVNFPKMFDKCIVPILESFDIKLVVSDHWQSSDMLQRLRSYQRVKAESYSLKWDDMLAIRTAWYDGRIKLPAPERNPDDLLRGSESLEDILRGQPVLKLLTQAMTVREVGRRVEKPLDGSSDDIFRAACLVARYLLDPELSRPFIYGGTHSSTATSTRGLGSVRSREGGAATVRGPSLTTERTGGVRTRRLDPNGIVTPWRNR